jgi:hypothetical protein
VVPDGEIHIGYLTDSKLADLPGQPGDQAGLGGAARCASGCCYVSGFAIINADVAGPDAATEYALAILRHELAHALGLGHAARPSLLMYHQIAASTTRYGRGEQHGLALLGPRRPSVPAAAPSRPEPQGGCSTLGQRAASSSWMASCHLAWCFASPAS